MMNKSPELFISLAEVSELAAQFFDGKSYLHELVNDPRIDIGIANVVHDAGSRTHWHVHKQGYQVLLVKKGSGLYQEEGKAIQTLKTGDTVVTHQGIKHWHGAQRNSWCEYVAITKGTVEWLESSAEA
ncbi:cupin domain-containing protein [Enterococcus sp. AZ109]|uniref:cupin domain-containing protein n=1 Tax=Enterococcus sp. AZ109 TaxID=2774634 RepID=UPI003F683184